MKSKNQSSILPDDVSRAWAFAFFGLHDLEQGNIMAAGVRRELRLRGYLSDAELSMIKMKYPHLTTHD